MNGELLLEEAAEEPVELEYSMRDERNLAELLDEDKLEEIGREARRLFLLDKRSRSQWETNRAAYLDSFLCKYEPTSFPWPDAANPRTPFLTEVCARFSAQFYEALMPAKGPVTVKSTGSEDGPRSQRQLAALTYQLQFESELPETMDYAGIQLPLDGTAFVCVDWDPDAEKLAIEAIPADQVVIPFRYRGPIEDAPRISRMLPMTPVKLRRLAKQGFLLEAAKDLGPPEEQTVEGAGGELRRRAQESDGIEPDAADPDGVRDLIQMHTHWALFDEDEDVACIVTFDLSSGKVLRIESREYLEFPKGEGNPAKAKVREFCHFVDFILIPNPSSGAYGIGFGQLLQSIIEAADDSLKQLLDAGQLASTSMGFVQDRSGLAKGDFSLRPGEFKPVETMSERIADDIFQFQANPPNPVLFQLLGLMSEYAQRLGSLSEVMQGIAPRGSNTTATEVMSLIEQGLKLFSAVHKRARRTLEKLFKKVALLDWMYLSAEKYSSILGTDWPEYRQWEQARQQYEQAQQVMSQIEVAGWAPPGLMEQLAPVLMNPPPESWASVDADFAPGVDVIPAADPEIVSRTEKLALAEKTMQVVMSVPSAAQNPQALWEAGRRILEAMGTEDVDKVLPAPPPPPPPPPPKPQEEELAGLLEGQPMHVSEQDDHQQHLAVLGEFKAGSYFAMLTPDQKDHLAQHEREHAAGQYRQQKGLNPDGTPAEPQVPAPGGPAPGPEPGGGAALAQAVKHALSSPGSGAGSAIDNAPPSLLGRFGDQLRAVAGTDGDSGLGG